MRNKKDDQPVQPAAEQQLEAKVDAMMDVSTPKPDTSKSDALQAEPTKPDSGLPPLDIFSDPATAPDVPKDLLKQLGSAEPAMPVNTSAAGNATKPTPANTDASLDDAVSDAAIDDIEAHESDDTLANEDAEQAEAAAGTQPVEKVRKIHHHPVFWTIIFLLCVVAFVAAYLLMTGGSNLPGADIVNKLTSHYVRLVLSHTTVILPSAWK